MKTLILLEMVILAGGGILIRKNVKGATWQQVILHDSLRQLIAVLIVTIILLSAVEIGLGTAAVIFGGLITLSYLMAALGTLGPAVQSAEQQLFS